MTSKSQTSCKLDFRLAMGDQLPVRYKIGYNIVAMSQVSHDGLLYSQLLELDWLEGVLKHPEHPPVRGYNKVHVNVHVCISIVHFKVKHIKYVCTEEPLIVDPLGKGQGMLDLSILYKDIAQGPKNYSPYSSNTLRTSEKRTTSPQREKQLNLYSPQSVFPLIGGSTVVEMELKYYNPLPDRATHYAVHYLPSCEHW